MKEIGPLVEHILRRNKLWQGYLQYRLLQQWPDLVGATIAEISRADSISNGILYVKVKDSVWSYHLSLMKPQFIDKLNKQAGSRLIKDIYFQIGSLEKKDN